jgi:Spy/CpxP family protein refolding chaperone
MERKYINLAAAAAVMFGTTTAMARPRGASSGASSSTATQTQPSCGDHMEKIKAALQQLDLSTNQKAQIKSIMANAKAAKSANKSAATTGTASKGEGREMMKQIVGVLTTPQAVKLKQLLKSERRK